MDAIVAAPKFRKFLDDIDKDAIDLQEFTVTDVDFFGPVEPNRLGFVKGKGIAFCKITGDPIPAIAFVRGASISVLIIVTIQETNQKFVLLCKQLRFPAGCVLTEACAGMMDEETGVATGVVFKEIREETGFVVDSKAIIELGNIRPSGGGCDEVIHLYAWETKISRIEFEEKQRAVYGEGLHEKIKLEFYEFERFDETLDLIGDAKAECCWRRYLRHLQSHPSVGPIPNDVSTADCLLESYGTALAKNLGPKIELEHQFLSQQDEAEMERLAFFRRVENISIVQTLLSSFEYEGSVEEKESELAIVASIGTSSTQVYSKSGVIGAFLVGSTALRENPILAGELLRQIVQASESKGVRAPIVLANSVGYFVKSSINLNAATDEVLNAVLEDETLTKAESDGDFAAPAAVAKQSVAAQECLGVLKELAEESRRLGLTKPCIVQCREKPKLKGDWLEVVSTRLGDQYPQGVYVVDFGGGGPDLHFFKRDEGLVAVDKDRSFRWGQREFVSEMMARRYAASAAFQKTVSFLRDRICAHAELHGVSPIVCKVFQTGMMRQQHYFGNIEPSSRMMTFNGHDVVTVTPPAATAAATAPVAKAAAGGERSHAAQVQARPSVSIALQDTTQQQPQQQPEQQPQQQPQIRGGAVASPMEDIPHLAGSANASMRGLLESCYSDSGGLDHRRERHWPRYFQHVALLALIGVAAAAASLALTLRRSFPASNIPATDAIYRPLHMCYADSTQAQLPTTAQTCDCTFTPVMEGLQKSATKCLSNHASNSSVVDTTLLLLLTPSQYLTSTHEATKEETQQDPAKLSSVYLGFSGLGDSKQPAEPQVDSLVAPSTFAPAMGENALVSPIQLPDSNSMISTISTIRISMRFLEEGSAVASCAIEAVPGGEEVEHHNETVALLASLKRHGAL